MKIASHTELLFFHLWKKDPKTLVSCEGVRVADTLIYRWAQPHIWYFTSKTGEISRKSKDKITPQEIETKFMEQAPPCGIIASYITPKEEYLAPGEPEKVIFEYLTAKEFPDFISKDEKNLNCMIQQFIQPKHNQNSMLKVSWTPQFCMMTKKTNIHLLDNPKLPIMNRIATFEGPEHFSNTESVASPIVASELETLCNRIVSHVSTVTSGSIQICRMVLYFKMDEENRLWLMYCTSLKFREKSLSISDFQALESLFPSKRKEGKESPRLLIRTYQGKKVEHNPNKKKAMYHIENDRESQDPSVCFNCDKTHEIELYDIKLGYVLKFHEENPAYETGNLILKLIKKKRGESNEQQQEEESDIPHDSRIPEVMYKLYPLLKYEKYKELRKNREQMEYLVRVCEDCYLRLTLGLINNKTVLKAREEQRNHILQLIKDKDPDSLKNRMALVFSQPKKKELEPLTHEAGQHTPGTRKAAGSRSTSVLPYRGETKTPANSGNSKSGFGLFDTLVTKHLQPGSSKEQEQPEAVMSKPPLELTSQKIVKPSLYSVERKGTSLRLPASRSGFAPQGALHSQTITSHYFAVERKQLNETESKEDNLVKTQTFFTQPPERGTAGNTEDYERVRRRNKELEVIFTSTVRNRGTVTSLERHRSSSRMTRGSAFPEYKSNPAQLSAMMETEKTSSFFVKDETPKELRHGRFSSVSTRSSNSRSVRNHRNNYSGIVNTIKDLRSFLIENSADIEMKD